MPNPVSNESKSRQRDAVSAVSAAPGQPSATAVGRVDAEDPAVDAGIAAERDRFVAAVTSGLADADAGRVVDHATVVARMRDLFGS